MPSRRTHRKLWLLVAVAALFVGLLAPAAAADPDPDEGGVPEDLQGTLELPDRSHDLEAHDALTDVISSEPSAKNVKAIVLRGLGERAEAGATTDVWVHENHAYTGTFNSPCGGEPGAGVWIWDVRNANKVSFVDIIPSPVGSRSNDVKVAAMNSGDILVHSNESCDDGPGGFEIYDVDDPTDPQFLAHVRIDEIAEITPFFFIPGALEDVGVHNLFLFTQGDKDYVAAQSEGLFDGFRIYDITDPTNPTLMSGWGAEEVFDPGVGDLTLADDPTGARTLNAVLWMLGLPPFEGFGASPNRLLHDFTVSADGTLAYLAHWDAGLILLDISDPSDPHVVSVALDPVNGSRDGEVNSHSVWPSEDGTIVVEGEEDFAPFESEFEITTGPNAGEYDSAEGAITVPIFTLPGQTMAGPTTYVGLACSSSPPVPTAGSPDQIALIQRGVCTFTEKIENADAAGYAGVVVFNDATRGDALVTMGGDPVDLPGVFVGHSTGLAIMDVASAEDLVIGASGAEVSATAVPNAWSGLRIWDYSDPANPVLASTFDTTCSADPVDPSCDPAGTYSAHNVIVETTGKQVKAYVSWYSDGMLVLDVSDPYNPVEVGRFLDNTVNANGEPNNFWGVYKVPNDPFIYGSDRNGGLYIFKEQGSGSGR